MPDNGCSQKLTLITLWLHAHVNLPKIVTYFHTTYDIYNAISALVDFLNYLANCLTNGSMAGSRLKAVPQLFFCPENIVCCSCTYSHHRFR